MEDIGAILPGLRPGNIGCLHSPQSNHLTS